MSWDLANDYRNSERAFPDGDEGDVPELACGHPDPGRFGPCPCTLGYRWVDQGWRFERKAKHVSGFSLPKHP